eukprot:GHVO01046601.1.p1 GENE.GHVO01046601.1~~GHVO01046601.1.p1  ORF type:complete len:150 (-),score=27.55 GHVO01046601.1:191-640(-)
MYDVVLRAILKANKQADLKTRKLKREQRMKCMDNANQLKKQIEEKYVYSDVRVREEDKDAVDQQRDRELEEDSEAMRHVVCGTCMIQGGGLYMIPCCITPPQLELAIESAPTLTTTACVTQQITVDNFMGTRASPPPTYTLIAPHHSPQ